MKNLIDNITNYLLSLNIIDNFNYEDSLFEVMLTLNSMNSKFDKEFKELYFDSSCYINFDLGFENISIIEFNEDFITIIGFEDSYEGYKIVLSNKNDKLFLKSYIKVDDETVDSEIDNELYHEDIIEKFENIH